MIRSSPQVVILSLQELSTGLFVASVATDENNSLGHASKSHWILLLETSFVRNFLSRLFVFVTSVALSDLWLKE